jgi:hypothetical protein
MMFFHDFFATLEFCLGGGGIRAAGEWYFLRKILAGEFQYN